MNRQAPFAFSQCEVAFISFASGKGADQNISNTQLSASCWRSEWISQQQQCWTSALSGLCIEDRNIKPSFQGLGVRKASIFFREKDACHSRGCLFLFLLSLAVFPLTESHEIIPFKATIINWSSWEKVHQVCLQLHYCQALLIYNKNNQLEMCGCMC